MMTTGQTSDASSLDIDALISIYCRKVATLQLLAGYLHLTGSHVSLMLHSLPHLSRLVQALVQVNVGGL